MLSSSGQSLEDKFNAVKHFLSGQGLSYVVLKATTSQLMGPKKKHLTYMVNITHEPNVSIPNLVKYLMQRARHPDWPVVFKSLISIHYLITYGNEKFIQNLASSNENYRSFNEYLSSFNDKSNTLAYDMSIFLRRYSRYLNGKINAYKCLGIDFCRLNKLIMNGSSDNYLYGHGNNSDHLSFNSNIKYDQLMLLLKIIQELFDLLVAFDANLKDLNNGIINTTFSMLYKDFVKLYIIYQTLIIRLLDLYFKCKSVKQVEEMLKGYKKFLIRMDKVSDFMRTVDLVGMDKSDMPKLSRSPSSLSLKLLEKYLSDLLQESTLKRRRESNNYEKLSDFSCTPIHMLPKIDLIKSDKYGTLQFARRRRNSNANSANNANRRRSFRDSTSQNWDQDQNRNQSVDFKKERAASLIKEEDFFPTSSNVFKDYDNLFSSGAVSDSNQCDNKPILDDNQIFSTDAFPTIDIQEEETKKCDDQQSLLLMGDSLDLEVDTLASSTGHKPEVDKKPTEWVQVDL